MDAEETTEASNYDDSGHRAVQQFLSHCHLQHYLPLFLAEGFDSLTSLYEITEDDMVAMGVKRGHRRLIQREIATSKGVPRSQPLVLNSLETKSSAMFYRPESSQAGDIESAEQGNGNSSTSTSGYGSMPSSASNRLSVSTGSGSCGSSVPTDMSGSNGTSASSGSGSMSSSSSSGGTSRKQSTVTNASNATSGSGNSSASNMSSDATSLTTPNTDGANNLKSKLVPPAPVANALNIARSAGDVGLSSTEDDDTASSATTANTSNGNSNRNSGGSGSNGDGISVHQPKRKYRRHPKRDKNAPVKPPSAYIMFSNHARAQMKEHNMSFADMAKSVGDQWKNLSQEEKQKYERTAMQAKDEYLVELEQYRKTPEYHKYQEYLKDFKHKQEAANRLISRARRRAHKNVGSPSSGSLADSSSNGGNGNGSNGSSSASSGGTDSLRPQSDDASTNTGESSTTSADGRLDQRDELLSNDARAAMQQQVFLVKPPPKQDKARPPVVCDSSVCSPVAGMITLPTFKHHKAKEENSPRQPSRLSNCHHRAPSPENCNREDSLPSSPAQLKVRTQNLTGYALRSRRSANVTPDMAQVNGSQEPPEPNGYHEQNNKSILHTKDRHTLSHPPSPRRDGLRPLPPPQKQPIKKRTTAVPASSSHEGAATINSTATAMQSIPATKAMGARGAAEAAEATEATAATATTANLQPAKKYQQGQSGKAS